MLLVDLREGKTGGDLSDFCGTERDLSSPLPEVFSHGEPGGDLSLLLVDLWDGETGGERSTLARVVLLEGDSLPLFCPGFREGDSGGDRVVSFLPDGEVGGDDCE